MASLSNEENMNTRLFVGGLDTMTENFALRDYFSSFGKITNVFIARDPRTKQSRGFGFISFENDGCLEQVLGTQPHCIDGKVVNVNNADTEEVKE